MTNEPIISVRDIHKTFVTGESGTLEVLKGASLTIHKGEVAAIVGASGSGKSTLLHIMGALDTPSEGTVSIGGQELFQLDDAALAKFRNAHIGFVFQFHHLLPEFSALENAAMPALIAGTPYNSAIRKAEELLDQVRVSQRMHAKPSQLSGGEQQRVAVARALMNGPAVVLADEPSGNLDEENAAMLHDLLWNLARERQQTFVIVTHDAALAKNADSVYMLHDGCIQPGAAS